MQCTIVLYIILLFIITIFSFGNVDLQYFEWKLEAEGTPILHLLSTEDTITEAT